jgi:hypothetical protein
MFQGLPPDRVLFLISGITKHLIADIMENHDVCGWDYILMLIEGNQEAYDALWYKTNGSLHGSEYFHYYCDNHNELLNLQALKFALSNIDKGVQASYTPFSDSDSTQTAIELFKRLKNSGGE